MKILNLSAKLTQNKRAAYAIEGKNELIAIKSTLF